MMWPESRVLRSVLTFTLLAACRAQVEAADTTLPTGRSIASPTTRSSVGVGSMPMNAIVSPDGKYIITTGAGFKEELCSVRVSDGVEISSLNFPKKTADHANGLYYGLAFGPDGRLYAAQGAERKVAIVQIAPDGKLRRDGTIAMGPHDFAAGIAIDSKGLVYVTQNDPIVRDVGQDDDDSSLPKFGSPASATVHDPSSGKELGRFVFEDDLGLSNFPLAVAVRRDGSRLYVGSQRDDAVYVLDTTNPAAIKQIAKLSTGSHPVSLLLKKDQTRLYVANAQSDTISIVDTQSNQIAGTVLLRPQIVKDLNGATPTGLELSPDEKTLYASLGDMNAVAVIDLAEASSPTVDGYIPVGWYPTSVGIAGGRLFVTNAKGDLARVPHNFSQDKKVTSPLFLFEGTLWGLDIPSHEELEALTRDCLENCRLTPKYVDGRNPLADISLKSGKIQHVIYVVKENRTYDQVLGDLPQGNGDTERNLFGRDVTPNLHQMAERFVLLDNFYDSGEVSGDGWTWSTQAQANEYAIRNVPYGYSNRGRVYDTEGTNNDYPTGGFPATGPDGKPLSADPRFANGAKAVPDVGASPGGHLWDMARKQGLSYRNYGYFLTTEVTKDGKTIIPDNYPDVAGVQPAGHDMAGITDIDFRRFDLTYPDSDAPSYYARTAGDPDFAWGRKSYGKAETPSRFSEWKREFDLMIAKDPTGGAVPNFITLRLGTDHTFGAKAQKPTPRCMVADNDYAIGQVVETLSHSPIWKSCALVILEDDAQNGPDHVDAHRSTCYIISPWIKKGSVDHSFQNTVSAIRTIECLLDLPPMCQYDAASDVIHDWDTEPRNADPYTAIMPTSAIMKERNPDTGEDTKSVSPENPPESTPSTIPSAKSPIGSQGPRADASDLKSKRDLAVVSETMDFSRADRVPADLLNEVIWKTVRGPKSHMPPTPHTIMPAGVAAATQPDKDDDDD
jgi:YVTN family beta-propeller protein